MQFLNKGQRIHCSYNFQFEIYVIYVCIYTEPVNIAPVKFKLTNETSGQFISEI